MTSFTTGSSVDFLTEGIVGPDANRILSLFERRGPFSLDGPGIKVMFALDIPTVELGLTHYGVMFKSHITNGNALNSCEVVSETPPLDIYCFLWKYHNSQDKWIKRFQLIFSTMLPNCI